MSHKYKLTYFNLYGRGEAIRMLFTLAGVEYEDVRVESLTGDEWKEMKPKTLFGGLPQLEIDGKVFCQSVAIARYLANKFGYAGKTDLDKLQGDMIVDCFTDMIPALEQLFEETDETKRKEYYQASAPKLDQQMGNLQKILEQNNGGNGYFVGDSVTLADLVWTGMAYGLYFLNFGPTLDKYTKLAAIKGRVEAEPRIAEWVAKRPVSPC